MRGHDRNHPAYIGSTGAQRGLCKTKPWQGPHLVERAIGATPLGLHHYIGVQEVGCNHVGHEGCILILEDHSHDVIPNVPLPLQLSTGPGAAQLARGWEGPP